MFGSDLPRSASDRLVVYLLGPGFGESVVVVVPDGRVLVADACVSGGQNLPRALLTALGLASITLLAITHPDLDHIEGVAELLTTYRPSRVWTFPLSATFRDAVARRARALGEPRLAALADAVEALDDHQATTGQVAETGYGRSLRLGDVAVHALAPTHYDRDRALKAWKTLVAGQNRGRDRLDDIIKKKRSLSDSPNRLSMALSLEYGDARLLLGGDVLRGMRSPRSGWKGILALLEDDDRDEGTHTQDRLRDVALVKVAHHGSAGAFDDSIWALHSKSRRPVAIVAPFDRGKSPLPDTSTLKSLAARATNIAVTAASGPLAARAIQAGLVPVAANVPEVRQLGATSGPVVAVEVFPTGRTVVHLSAGAAAYR